MYIFIGLSLLLILLIFLFAKKFTPNSFMMTSFKGNSFKTFSIGILIAAILSLSYGTYHAVTYQPSYLDIKLKKDTEVQLYFVSWKTIKLKNPVILIEYPSGKQETWKPNIVSIPVNKLQEKLDIKDIYQLSPYSFKESGEIILTIKENNAKNNTISIQIK
ncbi:hypothetical protein ACS2Q2_00130 [Bacillus cereus group sp. Bce009]|uniref:hypothetical protein n=1 Tax=Bacillus cereus group sp. Bce009 TaxID=3445252 RepID=UPI003F21768E